MTNKIWIQRRLTMGKPWDDSYRVTRLLNRLTPTVGDEVSKQEVQQLMFEGTEIEVVDD